MARRWVVLASALATALASMSSGDHEIFEQGLNPEISVQPEHQYLQCVPPRPRLNDPMMYCMDENLNNMRENFTAHCNASDGGTVVWLIGGYALVDSDQFSPEAYGVLVEDFESNISLFPCGADFLMGQFEESFNITCLSMVDEVNGCQSNDHLFFHEGFPDIEQPEVTVMKCNSDGSYDVMLKYEKFDDVEVCAVARGEDLTYSITLIESDCDDVVIGGDNISVLCRNVKNGMATATLEVCGGSFCKTANTSLTVSCNSATYGFTKNESSPTGYNIRFCANFPSSVDGNWGVALALSNGSDILVTDTLNGASVGDPKPAEFDPSLYCEPKVTMSSNGCTGSDCLSPAIVGSITAALFLVLILSTTVVVIGIAVGIHRRKKKQHNMIERRRSNSPAGVTVEFQQVNSCWSFNQFTDNLDTKLSSPERKNVPESVSLITHLEQELKSKKMLFTKQHLQLDKIIGEGESGVVYRGCIVGSEVVAVKTVKALSLQSDRVKLLKEVSLMLSFKHPNVMSLIGLCLDGDIPLIIMPFMSGGSLLEYVRRKRQHLYLTLQSSQNKVDGARKKCLDMCHQIAKGMSYLAGNKFVHRDLAARNCMIDGLVIKVADFGLAEDMYGTKYYRRSKSESEERVPIRWMAPESIETNIYNEATDVWSFGVTCWEVLTCGGVPYTGVRAMTLLTQLHSGHRLDRPRNAVCSQPIWDMMRKCWSGNPHQRPSFNELVKTLFNLLDSDTSYLRL